MYIIRKVNVYFFERYTSWTLLEESFGFRKYASLVGIADCKLATCSNSSIDSENLKFLAGDHWLVHMTHGISWRAHLIMQNPLDILIILFDFIWSYLYLKFGLHFQLIWLCYCLLPLIINGLLFLPEISHKLCFWSFNLSRLLNCFVKSKVISWSSNLSLSPII